MLSREDFVAQFMQDSQAGKFEKINQPNCGDKLTDAFISEEVNDYKEILRSDIVKNIIGSL